MCLRGWSLTASLLCLATSIVSTRAALQNPRDDFCRRYGHQTTVIDDKLYIDGGWIDYTTFKADRIDSPNTFLAYHDLNNVTQGVEPWPQLNVSLNKDPRTIPTVAGGVLWGDSVNKKFFVYGGETTSGLAQDYRTYSYDILYDKWDDLGAPKTPTPPNIASYGAGVGVSETGQGYFYGGWVKNTTMRGWTKAPAMSPDFYRYDYDANKLTLMNAPDKLGRAEGAMVWIPAGDTGLVVYFGGLVDTLGNGTRIPQPMNKISVFDPSTNTWFAQTAVGEVPQNRSQFCADVAWAPDKSSYNIYIWGGLNAPPPVVNTTAFNDVYVLSLPSFTWVKLWPGHSGNATFDNGHYAASCNMVKSRSQLMVIGGTYPNPGDESICDSNADHWAQHNLWTGTINNAGDNDTYWALYDRNVNTSVVPKDVFNVVGGNKFGGATLLAPKGGYDTGSGTGTGLAALLQRKPRFSRTATRTIPSNGATAQPKAGGQDNLSTGAIAGIAIAGVAVLLVIGIVWFLISKRVHRRRQERRAIQSQGHHGHSSAYGGDAPIYVAHSDHYTSPMQRNVSYDYPPPAEMPAGGEKTFASYHSSPVNHVPVEAAIMSPSQKSTSPHTPASQPLVTPVSQGTPSPILNSADGQLSPQGHTWTSYHSPHR